MNLCGNEECGHELVGGTDDSGNGFARCPSCGWTRKSHSYSVNLEDRVDVTDRLDISARDATDRVVAERASASTKFGDTSSGIDVDTNTHHRAGRMTERTNTEQEETLAGEAVARVLSAEDGVAWVARHVGAGGNLVDVELTCGKSYEELQVTFFDKIAIEDLKSKGSIKAENKSGPVHQLTELLKGAAKRKMKYPAHDRAAMLLVLHTPLPVTPAGIDEFRKALATLPHGYREVWLADATSAYRLTGKAAQPRTRSR